MAARTVASRALVLLAAFLVTVLMVHKRSLVATTRSAHELGCHPRRDSVVHDPGVAANPRSRTASGTGRQSQQLLQFLHGHTGVSENAPQRALGHVAASMNRHSGTRPSGC